MATCWPVLKDACCCCTLETCCKVQGWLALIATPFVIALGSASIAIANDSAFDGDENASARSVVLATGAIMIIYGILLGIMDIFFLVGISKRRPAFIAPYVIYLHIGLVLALIEGIMECTTSIGSGIAYLIFGCGLQLYMLLCANSLHVTMKAESSATA